MFLFIADLAIFKTITGTHGVKVSWWNWQVNCGGSWSSLHIKVCNEKFYENDEVVIIYYKKLCVVSNLQVEVNHPGKDSSKSRVRINKICSQINKNFILGSLDLQVCVYPLKRPRPLKLSKRYAKFYKEFMKMMKFKTLMTKMMMKVSMMMKVTMMITMLLWNQMMRMEHGNGRRRGKFQWIDVAFQNLPQGLSLQNKEENIERILHHYRPHILGLAEPRTSELSTMFFDGYSLVPGTALGIINPRLNVLIKDGLDVEFLPFETEIPSLLLKIGQVKLLFVYREWAKDGDEDLGSFPHQEARWSHFVDLWSRLRGRVNVIGDCNLEYWRMETAHHRNCQGMKTEVMEKIIPRGYVQCITEDTRHQGRQSSCIDHLYTNNAQFVDKIVNKSVTSYDHNMIKFKMMLDSPAFQPRKIEMRKVVEKDYIGQ